MVAGAWPAPLRLQIAPPRNDWSRGQLELPPPSDTDHLPPDWRSSSGAQGEFGLAVLLAVVDAPRTATTPAATPVGTGATCSGAIGFRAWIFTMPF